MPTAILPNRMEWYSLSMEITVKLPEALAARAQASGLTPDAWVERLLNAIAQQDERSSEARGKLHDELKADWEHFLATGLHLDGDEVDTWFDSIEHGQNPPLPELHV